MIFPFLPFFAAPSAAFPNRRRVIRPVVRATLEYGGRTVDVLALVDSGADYCLFPESVGLALGIPLPNSNVAMFSGTADQRQIAYFEHVKAFLKVPFKPSQAAFSFELYAGFCRTIEHLGLGLLGQHGFFSRYRVTIDHTSEVLGIV
jgi:hypothetical protein